MIERNPCIYPVADTVRRKELHSIHKPAKRHYENLSENYGAEGEMAHTRIEDFRKRQIKNFLLSLLISRGVPMLLGGDEFRRTQGGNNNAYCQDNETSWYDWRYLERHQDIYRFAREMIAFAGRIRF